MKHLLVCFISLFILFSCQEQKVSVSKLNESFGARNEVAIVIEDSLWNNWVGDSIRKFIVRQADNRLVNEPMFDIVQYSPKIFSAKAKLSRNILAISIDEKNTFSWQKSVYASPQNVFYVNATDSKEIVTYVKKYADSIVNNIRLSELNEEQHYINRIPTHSDSLFKALIGSTIQIPLYYQLAMYTEEPFLWYQKALPSGDVNLTFYEFPIEYIEREGGTVIEHILQAKDSVAKNYIKGAKSFSYLMIDSSFTPMIEKRDYQNIPYYHIQGKWKMMNDFVYGPYILYVFKDDYYKRYLFVEGFINDTNKPKRDHLMELEAIMQSINFYEDNL